MDAALFAERMVEMRPRKVHTEAVSETGEEAVGGKRRRREGRGWGPFSGGQLTIIIVAICVMVMLPVGAFAVVSGSNVFVTDATSGVQAKVNASGELQTGFRITTVLSNSTMTVPAFSTVALFTNVNVQPYHGVRLFLGESGADPTTQQANVLMSLQPYVLDNFVMNTANVSRFYELPGANMTVTISNNSANDAQYTWRVFGRTN
jgi:hypothetical protein